MVIPKQKIDPRTYHSYFYPNLILKNDFFQRLCLSDVNCVVFVHMYHVTLSRYCANSFLKIYSTVSSTSYLLLYSLLGVDIANVGQLVGSKWTYNHFCGRYGFYQLF